MRFPGERISRSPRQSGGRQPAATCDVRFAAASGEIVAASVSPRRPVACMVVLMSKEPASRLLAISKVPSFCVYRSRQRSDALWPGYGSTHGLRKTTAVITERSTPGDDAKAISTYPTPGSKMFPPTTWCENSAFAWGVSAIGEVIVSSDQAPLYKRNCSQDDVTRTLRRATRARARYSERPLAPCLDHV